MTPLLPAPVAGWPALVYPGGEDWPAEDVAAALARIRSETLWWPTPKSGAQLAEVLTADIATSDIDPSGFQHATLPDGHPMGSAAVIAGLADGDPEDLLRKSSWIDPWRGSRLSLAEGVEALSFLHMAARRNRGRFRLIGMSRWKRRSVSPFLAGPDGTPGDTGAPVVWGASAEAPEGALRVEDGFLRSVGLGLRHTPPASLTFDTEAPYFDATRRNGFETCAEASLLTPALVERAKRLRARILDLRLSKYNLASNNALPAAPDGKEAVLVPGQVETDASIRLGARDVRRNEDLIKTARAAFPDAFLVYKPHPDVLTGLREGAAPTAAELADHVEIDASAPDCLDWADRVVTMTSLMGFEALMRGKAVTTLGRPFYSGWGLTDDRDPPPRGRRLTLDELVAVALILYPRYIDPVTRLPAPVEVVVEALAKEMKHANEPTARMTRLWRNAISWVMNRL